MNEYTITLTWDDEAQRWIAESDDIPGLVLEARTVDALIEEAQSASTELLELMGVPSRGAKLRFTAERYTVVA
jgi:predicted RNase H-like HicB family nuclease